MQKLDPSNCLCKQIHPLKHRDLWPNRGYVLCVDVCMDLQWGVESFQHCKEVLSFHIPEIGNLPSRPPHCWLLLLPSIPRSGVFGFPLCATLLARHCPLPAATRTYRIWLALLPTTGVFHSFVEFLNRLVDITVGANLRGHCREQVCQDDYNFHYLNSQAHRLLATHDSWQTSRYNTKLGWRGPWLAGPIDENEFFNDIEWNCHLLFALWYLCYLNRSNIYSYVVQNYCMS